MADDAAQMRCDENAPYDPDHPENFFEKPLKPFKPQQQR